MSAPGLDDGVLAEQVEYYRARAAEYDRWWNREGRFDRGPDANGRWFAEVEALERVLREFRPRGDVLELACGTGLWTRRLVEHAERLTAVDASPEVLQINRARVGGEGVEYVLADLFEWEPEREYDCVVFTFWLSHVPRERFAGFWQTVARALAPDGRVLLFDSARTERSTAADHVLPAAGEQTMTRRLDDGREFRIIKRFYEPEALSAELKAFGWEATAGSTGEFFVYATARAAAEPPAAAGRP